MAHLRVVQITGAKGKEELKILPGEFASDRECRASITQEGEYLFLEVHHLTGIASQESKKKNHDKA